MTRAIWLLWLTAAVTTTSLAAAAADRFLVVRYDDYAPAGTYTRSIEHPDDKPVTPAADAARPAHPELETRLFELFGRYDARIVAGAIPFPIASPAEPERLPGSTSPSQSWLSNPQDPWVVLLRQYVANGTVEPALHGYEHRKRTGSGHRPGEFFGQPYTWQRSVLQQGRDALTAAIGRPVRVFVPPWNAWDARTARALDELGFTWLSPDLHHADLGDSRLRLVAQTAGHPDVLLQLLASGQDLPPGSILVLTTHPFDFEGPRGQQYFRSLEQLLVRIQAEPAWACVGLQDLPPAEPDAWQQRFRQAVRWHATRELASDMYGLSGVAGVDVPAYWPSAWYGRHTWRWQAAAGGALLLSAAMAGLIARLLTALAGRLAMKRSLRFRRGIWLVAILLFVATVVLIAGAVSVHLHGYHIRGVRWQAIVVAAGSGLGVWTYLWRRSRSAGSEQVVPLVQERRNDQHGYISESTSR